MIRVNVPATSANLGPGFDVLGLAVDLYNSFIFEKADDFNVSNMITDSYKKVFDLYGQEPIPVKLTQDKSKSQVPTAGGLGSSSTCIVAGVVAALAMMEKDDDREEVLRLSNIIEGHPDNVAPAIYGNLIASIVDDDMRVHFKKFKVSDKLKFLAIVPDFSVETSLSRSVLPEKVSRHDAISNMSRLVFLLDGFESGSMEKLRLGLVDKLHQEYRKGLVRGFEEIRTYAKELGAGFFLSGAGATMMVVSDKDLEEEMKAYIGKNYPTYQVIKLNINDEGYKLENK